MTYKLYTVEPLGPHDLPLVIAAAYRNPGGYLKGEWFIVIPEADPGVLGQTTRFNYKEIPADLGELDEAFMQREMLDQATLRLRTYIHERKIEIGAGRSRWQPELQAASKGLFIHLWVRGGYGDALRKVFHATSCDALRADIEAVSVLDKYDRRDLE
ncbi:hypothetical protein [Usitatibacter palustris]|uniref:hypothetical protein n=1 Tax=Usitatibacter palustris TaxID=2732487 RepID=UPI001487899C|nr:hypothetical protein [Usitatibacter palustris]